MDWKSKYCTSRTLIIRPTGLKEFEIAGCPYSDKVIEIDLDGLQFLSHFAKPAVPEEVIGIIQASLSISQDEMEAGMEELIKAGFLIPADASSGSADRGAEVSGFGNLLEHHMMLFDQVRVNAYRDALFRHARGQTVLDLGCGTGILSIFAAQAGARKVYAIEESSILEIAQDVVRANGFGQHVEFRRGNSLDITLPEKVDVIVHELIGTKPFGEGMLHYLYDAKRRFLRPEGRFIPKGIEVFCIGIESQAWIDRSTVAEELHDLAQSYRIDLTPVISKLSSHVVNEPRILNRLVPPSWKCLDAPGRDPEILQSDLLSDEIMLYNLDFVHVSLSALNLHVETELSIRRRGNLNAMLIYFRVNMDEEASFTNFPQDPATHWGCLVQDLPMSHRVNVGDRLRCRATIHSIDRRDEIRLDIG